MKKIILVITVTLVMITSCGVKETDAIKFKEEYEKLNGEVTSSNKSYPTVDVSEENIVKYATIDEIIDIIKNGTGVIYLGYPECPWCRNTVPALFEAADSTPLDTIYYLNMHDVRDTLVIDANGSIATEKEGEEKYKDLLEALDSILDNYTLTDSNGNSVDTGEKRIYVPLVVFVKNGVIVDYQDETVPTQTDPYIPLTEEEKNQLINIYIEKINKVADSSCDEGERC